MYHDFQDFDYHKRTGFPHASGRRLCRRHGKFNSNVTIKFNGSDVNGKSLMNIIAAGIKCGSTIEIVCEGDDENAALDSAVALVESGFGE